MNPLFSKSSSLILESLSFTKTLYAFDFDGTLSPIVKVPSDARMNNTTAALLRRLSHLAPVAVISGRSISDLKHRLPFEPQYLVGNHGLEGLSGNLKHLENALQECRLWKKKLSRAIFDKGVEIEDKTYSIAIHYRRSRNKKVAKKIIQKYLQMLEPKPRVVYGKSVVNLLPLDAPHKGLALVELIEKAKVKHAFYIGDDDTDEDVFTLTDSRIMTVRVGNKKNSEARFFIGRQSQINRLLTKITRYYSKE